MKTDKALTKVLEKWAKSEEGAKAVNKVMEKALQTMLNKWAKTGVLPDLKKKAKKSKTKELGFAIVGERPGDR